MMHTVDILKPRPNVCNCVCISLNENLRILFLILLKLFIRAKIIKVCKHWW